MHHSHLANNATATATVGAQSPGRTNLAHSVEEELHQQNCRTFVLDDGNVRHGLNTFVVMFRVAACPDSTKRRES